VAWRPVEARLIRVRWLTLAGWLGPLLLLGLGLCLLSPQAWSIGATAALALLALWSVWRVPRQVRALNYAIRDGDFLKRSGLLFRRLEVVPHIRIQYVDVEVGPLRRAFKLATLNVHTATPGLTASLPGLSPETAAGLRDQLTARDKLRPVDDDPDQPVPGQPVPGQPATSQSAAGPGLNAPWPG
jgi:membrane protein YdbS with pleckstrin-like domain